MVPENRNIAFQLVDLVDKVNEQLNEDMRDKVDWAYEIVYAQRIADSDHQYL